MFHRTSRLVQQTTNQLYRIMPYNTTGASHRVGVSNEKKITDFLNSTKGGSLRLNELFGQSLQFKQIGGTKSVSDMDIMSEEKGELLSGVSIKNHKQGSYDYVNTSKLVQFLPESVVSTIKEGVVAIKSEYVGNEEKLPEARKKVESLLEQAFAQFDDVVIKKLLQTIGWVH